MAGKLIQKAQQTLALGKIKIGKRFRKELGDLSSLKNSIADVGLLHPIVVRKDGALVAGARRLAAIKALGWDKVPVTVVDLDEIVRGEYAENVERSDFLPTELVAIRRALAPIEAAEAKKRQGKRTDLRPTCAKVSHKSKDAKRKDRAIDRVAGFAGVSGRSLEKATEVVEAAEAEPEKYGALAAEMDRTGKIDGAYRALKQSRVREKYESRVNVGGQVTSLEEIDQRFGVIYADPPWEFHVYSGKGKQRSAERHYDTASLESIKRIPVERLAAKDCALLLWCVMPELPGALEVIKAWGFEYKTCGFGWVKQNRSGDGLFWGMGYWTRANLELCLLATRGSPQRLNADVHQIVMAPVDKHSRKPAEVRARIQRLVPGPYIELFAREAVDGWVTWGNELAAAAAE